MAFSRTPQGMAEKWRFVSVPTVWVEGTSDIWFYWPPLAKLSCRIESYDGIENAHELIRGAVEKHYPYIVVMDGHYDILSRRVLRHRNIVVLKRHSFENYLWEPETVNSVCLLHAQCEEWQDLLKQEMQNVENHLESALRELIEIDIAAYKSRSGVKILPSHIDALGRDKNAAEIQVCAAKIRRIIDSSVGRIPPETITTVKKDLKVFLKDRSLIHILNGHFLFGIVRIIFLNAAKKIRKNSNIPNDALIELLATRVWQDCPSADHRNLKRSLRDKIRSLQNHYSAKSGKLTESL